MKTKSIFILAAGMVVGLAVEAATGITSKGVNKAKSAIKAGKEKLEAKVRELEEQDNKAKENGKEKTAPEDKEAENK